MRDRGMRWLVRWELDIDDEDARTPEEAAEFALAVLRHQPAPIAACFAVADLGSGTVYKVDLTPRDEE